MLLDMNPFSSQLIGWGLMVVAMMLPKLIMPVQSICIQSFRRYRFLCSLLFVLGYLAAWMVAGIFMVAVIIGLNLLMPVSYIPALGVFIIAVVWQFSPVKQRFLNLGHNHYILSAFGWAACRDSLIFGVIHGVWCIGSGWALMLFPMLLPQGHNLAMIVVTFIMISEHLEHPRASLWRFRIPLRLLRFTVAQTQIKLKRVQG
jgi:predicted metal-binding membrane protein